MSRRSNTSNDIRPISKPRSRGASRKNAGHGLCRRGDPHVLRTGDTRKANATSLRKGPPHSSVSALIALHPVGLSRGRRSGPTRTVSLMEDSRDGRTSEWLHRPFPSKATRRPNQPLTVIGLSATQKPIGEVSRFPGGDPTTAPTEPHDCTIIRHGYFRARSCNRGS